ncbi:murein biosynthesis integral membrane protein MurJ [Helicobacter sp.]|uniref:murein biosynthesis integral membrane protein MurJ n=1 Tax=Helicobacter sp. TaxID=218 RepID=UPI0025BDFAD4|nr:murein biosynthesis integral membrane protein MurJ [Helicobacter sp.]MCI5968458.1 murein biosynthesis integral membrane protein MurJ [Helicobacter sp.]MDY2585243.1 murein biosynthesis integral membrane protein MurJ [Helicobacter sp.]
MFLKGFFTNSSGILTSRILGFFRDLLTANTLGAGMYSDMFFVAFKLPNLFRRIFGEGAFNQSFLPGFFKARLRGGFALKIGLIFCTILLALCLFVSLFSEPITKLLAFGFSKELIALTAPLVAINFWYLPLVFIVTLFGAMLQYKRNFTAWAYSPALLNLAMIISLLLAQNSEAYEAVLILSYGVLAGGIAQIALHFIPMYNLGFLKLLFCGAKELKDSTKQNRKNSINASIKQFFKQFFPAMLGSSTAQIASFIDTLLASFLASGAISYLYYANRIFQLPLAVFAIATSTALFPLVAKYIKESKEKEAINALAKSFWLLFVLLSLCTLGGTLLKDEMIWLLFERGKFTREDTLMCASVFGAYLIGLLPFGLSRIFSLWLYSYSKQALAAKISAFSLLVGTIFSLILMQFFGAVGLAFAGSISGFVVFFLTLHYFSWQKFFKILWNLKLICITCGLLGLEYLVILGFKQYIFKI